MWASLHSLSWLSDMLARWLTPTCWVTQSEVFATHSGVFVEGGAAYLVDPGVRPEELDTIAAFVTMRGAEVQGILLTHAHWDHLLGPSRFPDASVIAAAAFRSVIQLHGRDLRHQVARWAAGEGLEGYTAFEPPEPDIVFRERLTLRLGASTLSMRAAPGHAPDHSVIYQPEAGLLWAGDMLSDLEVPMVMDTFVAYLQTLRGLSRLRVEILVPGHGTATADPDEIDGRFSRDEAYLEAVCACVGDAVREGASLNETLIRCQSVPFSQPDSYPHAHQWNIEQAYLEQGGAVEGVIGWEKDWG